MRTRRFRLRASLGLALAWLALAAPALAQRKSLVGQQTPDFSLTDLDGHRLTTREFRGRVLLVDFWATWCGPCREEVPLLRRLRKRFGPRGFEVLGLSLDDTPGPVAVFRRRYGIPYPLALADLKTVKSFGTVLGLPLLFLVRPDGVVAYRHRGAVNGKELAREIEAAFRVAPPRSAPQRP